MPLTLTVVRYRNQACSEPFGTSFDTSGGSIGRAASNDWVLPDEEKIISGKHAFIEYQSGEYYVVDNSSNGVYLNESDEPIGKGNSLRIGHGDVLTIGDYDIRIDVQDELGTGTFGGPDLIEEPMDTGLDVDDIFSDVEPLPAAAEIPQPRPEQEYYRPPDLIPDDLTGFQPAPAGGGVEVAGEFDDDLSGFDDFADTGDGMIPGDMGAGGGAALPDDDWNITVDPGVPDELPASPAPPSPSAKTRTTPKPKPGSRRRTSSPPPRAQPRAAPAAPSARPTASGAAGMDAFLAGAGMSEDLLQSLTPKMAFTLGQTYREAVKGTMAVLMARAKMKSEFRMDMTVIRPEENNPLKFSLGIDEALQKMVTSPNRGHLGPVAAMREAYQDIQAHQIAVMAGMRAALRTVLKKLHPARLERRLQSHSMLDAVLPQNRKAKTWDLFTELYNDIASEAEEDFQRLFGEEFRRAYEQHMKILTREDKSAQ